jgi:hypothetical protein
MMPPEQIFIGAATAVLCAIGLVQRRWVLENTRKGRWLVERVGPRHAARVLVALLACGAVFGTLLAIGVVNPVRW